MKKYHSLLSEIANEFSIKKGKSETENQWKVRLIYSVVGRMALASVWDIANEESISIVHMKRRIKNVFNSYREMYPEVSVLRQTKVSELADEIYDIYEKTGLIYHKSHRILMSAKTSAFSNDVKFTRGHALDEVQNISGLGTFVIENPSKNGMSLNKMFQLENERLVDLWKWYVDSAKWEILENESPIEYLKMEAPFNWVDKPDNKGRISILKMGFKGSTLYYLYKMNRGKLAISQLPRWQTEECYYRSISNACLCAYDILPATRFSYDGGIVNITFKYLPPPAELYLWKLYTWPASCDSFPCDFRRVCDRQVFEAIKKTMIQQGYKFIEE